MLTNDVSWLAEHGPEIQDKYRGKWIAVRDGKVVGVGETAPEAVAQAEADDPNAEFVLQAVDTETDVIYAQVSVAQEDNASLW